MTNLTKLRAQLLKLSVRDLRALGLKDSPIYIRAMLTHIEAFQEDEHVKFTRANGKVATGVILAKQTGGAFIGIDDEQKWKTSLGHVVHDIKIPWANVSKLEKAK